MRIKLFSIIALLAAVAVACTPQQSKDIGDAMMDDGDAMMEDTTKGDAMMDDGEKMEGDDAMMEDDADSDWLSFDNRAEGYTVDHPTNWYWRHYISEEIPGEQIHDYFIADPLPLTGFGSEYLGRYVVETSDTPADTYIQDFTNGYDNVTREPSRIDGVAATRLRGVGAADSAREGWTLVTHVFEHEGKTYRVMYTMFNSSNEDEAMFEAFVHRIALNK